MQRTNDPANATELSFDDTVSGVISSAAEMETYTFEGTAGDSVLLRMVETDADLTPALRLFRPDGELFCNGWTYDTTLTLECELEANGKHTILASGSDSGEYTLSLERLN